MIFQWANKFQDLKADGERRELNCDMDMVQLRYMDQGHRKNYTGTRGDLKASDVPDPRVLVAADAGPGSIEQVIITIKRLKHGVVRKRTECNIFKFDPQIGQGR